MSEQSEAEARDALRDLCVAVASLASGCVQLIGTQHAAEVVEACGRVSARMDEIDARRAGDE